MKCFWIREAYPLCVEYCVLSFVCFYILNIPEETRNIQQQHSIFNESPGTSYLVPRTSK